MNIAYSWLKEYINTSLSPQEIGTILTQIGLETGSIDEVETIKGGLKGLVIGEVLTCKPHPDSDHLSVTTVNVGQEVLPIVCGAPNVAAGQKVVVACVGTTLYDGDQDFKIKKSKIRGEVSEGMICSEKEIGLGDRHEGIMVLDPSAVPGTAVAAYFKLENESVLEVDLTPNRIDSGSHIGVARDLAAYLKQQHPDTKYTRPSVEAFKVDDHALEIPVEVATPAACHRYAGVTITGLKVQASPEWLQNRLRSVGLKPINNVVDVTNYVLYETGQPLHAFDAAAIKGNKVVVSTLAAGTRFETLDGIERELHADDLMICNAELEPMCIGGVFGGEKSGVKESTTTVFLESAWFDPVYIRKTARRHGLNTDASFRFERGTDPNGVIYALKRAALLIVELTGGVISSEIVDIYPEPAAHFGVSVSLANVKRLIGIEIPQDTIRNILSALEIDISHEADGVMQVKVPPYRVDVKREADVIEEILRIYGYNNVAPETHVRSTIQYSPNPDPEKVRNQVADYLASNGFNEIWSNSLTKASYYEGLETLKAEHTVNIFNPLSQDLNAMRQSLLFGGLEAILRNSNYQQSDLRLFELGNTYFYKGGEGLKSPADKYHEELHLAMFMTGNKEAESWTGAQTKTSFYLLKVYVENILKRLGFTIDRLRVESLRNDLIEEGLEYTRGDGKVFVQLGFVQRKLLKKAEIDTEVFYADFHWYNIEQQIKGHKSAYTELPKFPAVRRDLALLVDEQVSFSQLKAIAMKTERKLLRNVDIFDVYKGDKLPAGKKSYALSFILRDDEKTLNDKVIEATMNRFVAMFERETGAKLR